MKTVPIYKGVKKPSTLQLVHQVLTQDLVHLDHIYKQLPDRTPNAIAFALTKLKEQGLANNPERGYWRRKGRTS